MDLLIRALDFSGVARAAAYALGEIGDLRAVEPLALASLRVDQETAPSLREGFFDPLQKIVTALPIEGINVLVRLESTVPMCNGSAAYRLAATMVTRIGLALPSGVLSTLRTHSASNVRLAAFQVLSEQFGIDEWIAALKDSDLGVRRRAARALCGLKDPRSVEPLIAAVDECSDALFVLFEIGDARAFQTAITVVLNGTVELKGAAKFERPYVSCFCQARAVDFLARLNDPRAVGPLIDLIDPLHPLSKLGHGFQEAQPDGYEETFRALACALG